MDARLTKLAQSIPGFFSTIKMAILSARSNAGLNLIPIVGKELGNNKRRGYANWLFIEPYILDCLNGLADPRIKTNWSSNVNGSSNHLEIETPFGKFMVASVDRPCSVPRSALYRQEITNQIFFSEAFPEFSMSYDLVIPLYLITYSDSNSLEEPCVISIGRLNYDQRRWSNRWPINDLLNIKVKEEVVNTAKPSVREEIITASRKIRKKSV